MARPLSAKQVYVGSTPTHVFSLLLNCLLKEVKVFQVLILHHKSGDQYLLCDAMITVEHHALDILKHRLESENFYLEDDVAQRAREILELKDRRGAWRFLQNRSDCEYEGVALEPLGTAYNPYYFLKEFCCG